MNSPCAGPLSISDLRAALVRSMQFVGSIRSNLRPVLALLCASAACGTTPTVTHGNISAGACTICRTDGGTYFDECAIVGQYTYDCVGSADGGASCQSGRCALSCSTSLDCRLGVSCDTVHSLSGDIQVCGN